MSPRPATISRDQVVQAAVTLLDEGGVEAFSMRRLGAAMGVDPMAVYHHLPNKAALFDAVVEHLWSCINLDEPDPSTAWPDTVRALAHGLRDVLLAHPNLVGLVGTRPAVTPNLLDLVDRTVGWLTAAGLDAHQSLRLLDCVVGYVIGKVQGELRQPVGGTAVTPEEAFGALTPHHHPHLTAALGAGYDWAPELEFRLGLDAMLRGWTDQPAD